MGKIVFLVEEAPEGGLRAGALGGSIVTRAGAMEGLREQVRDAGPKRGRPQKGPE